ncbi:aminoglycoside phosphotransferase family protein [Streptomyces sp. NPDC057694]|uniref:aminoglycoside phosphotransferase family protein n=1 Tax=Streptomyces sp. NPDC057694 TaxID=3346216 RepID=UPI0036CBEBB5
MREPPSEDTARRLLKTVLPDGDGDGVELRAVAADGGHAAWRVGTGHVLRLAADGPASRELRREVRLRDLVRPYVTVAVPACAAAGEWAPGLAYTLDTRLPGASAEIRDVTAAGEEDLAGLLAGLRTVPVARAVPLGAPAVAPRSLENLRREAGVVAGRLDGAGEFEAARLGQLTAQGVTQLGPQPDAVLVHHDLNGERLTVSADGRVRGVLGWAGVVVGDPAEDIAGLAISVGARAAVRGATLAGYGARVCLRGLWLGRCDALVRLSARLSDGGDAGLSRIRLERAWEPILLELVTD